MSNLCVKGSFFICKFKVSKLNLLNMSSWIVQTAYKLSKHSQHHKYKMAAVVLSGGRVLSWANNSHRVSRHAELMAIARDIDFTGAVVIVVRENGGCSRPCRACFHVIKQAGIRKMIFVDEQGNMVSRLVSDENPADYRDYGQER